MSREYCPRCRALRNSYYSAFKTTLDDGSGGGFEVVVVTHYCEFCHGFIYSEYVPVGGDIGARRRSRVSSRTRAGRVRANRVRPCFIV